MNILFLKLIIYIYIKLKTKQCLFIYLRNEYAKPFISISYFEVKKIYILKINTLFF